MKMDAILDICYKEKLFKLPNIATTRYIPVKLDYKYCTSLLPILESDRVSREKIVALCCRQTHQVKPKSIYVNEDDVLYSIFGIRVGQTLSFMSTWLKLYADMYCRQFKKVTANYLKSKVLEFDHWWESIKDGRKGDVTALLGQNYLMGTHTMVHLSGNRIWSTHQGNLLHDDIVNKCEFHLLYLGRGIMQN